MVAVDRQIARLAVFMAKDEAAVETSCFALVTLAVEGVGTADALNEVFVSARAFANQAVVPRTSEFLA